MTSHQTHYDLLGVARSVDAKTLRSAFYRLSKALHPDTTALPAQEASRKFRQVYEAYELLSDPHARAIYDQTLNKINSKGGFSAQPIEEVDSSAFNLSKKTLRPLSGGELFSLSLLIIAILISLMMGIGFALLGGIELQVRPSWLVINSALINLI